MNAQSSYPTSQWIDFLRQYGPIPRNDNMYDEAIQRALQRKKVEPIKFETEHFDELIQNFKSSAPYSIILTGTAGDGKTFYCRQIWEALGGSPDIWNQSGKIQFLTIGQKKLIVVKDLSELTESEKIRLLTGMADSIIQRSSTETYLVAANDGQLVEAWAAAGDAPNVQAVRQGIEDLLVADKREKLGLNLRLYNLSRLSAAQIFPRILDAVLQHPGWEECTQCSYRNAAELSQRCPIWENKTRLEGSNGEKTTRSRLIDLLELCELNGMHLPIRQLLLLVANTLLGHPDAKDRLLSCKQVPHILAEGKASLASLYRNIFGENLSERRRESTYVFAILRSFGIGTETSNRIDNTLIFGLDDPELKPYYEQLVLSDPYYGADQTFSAAQKSYLEGTSSEDREDFLGMLQNQQQRLFFTIPPEQASEMKLWNLTAFQYAGEYLEDVYRALQQGKRISKQLVSRLVRGMNRIFTGLLVNNQDELILATSGSYSQARISRVFEESISVPKKRGESISLELDPEQGKPDLIVSLSSNEQVPPVKLRLHLTRYEYLSRVAEGALPSSFSQECYEDMLAFKTQVLRQLSVRRQKEEEESDSEDHMMLRLLELNSDGMASHRPLEIQI